MEIVTVNHSDRYSIEQISCLFFGKDDNVRVVSEYDGLKKIITHTFIDDRQETAEWHVEAAGDRGFKNAVKKSAYLSMCKISEKDTPWGILTGIRPTKFCRDLHEKYSYNEIKNILENEYWVSGEKSDFCIEVTENSERIINTMDPDEAEIYIGVPFCPSRCSYCSFISESAALYKKYIPEYVEALKKEIVSTAELIKEYGFKVGSLYIGGGTPPALGVALLEDVIKTVREVFATGNDTEFTVEAGRPDVIDESLLAMLRSYGVNRLCINPQTMNNDTLSLIGRNHTAEQTETAFELARKYSFSNINSDIIAGLPGEDKEMFFKTLERIGALDPEEVTVHTMYLKRTSKITKEKLWNNCGNDVSDMINAAMKFAHTKSYIPYYMYKQRSTLGNLENTGYAKAGYESLYNVAIMEEVRTVLACGAGASSKLVKNGDIERVYNIKDAFSYTRDIDLILSNKHGRLNEFFNNEQIVNE